MRQQPVLVRAAQAAALLALSVSLVACSTTPSTRSASQRAATSAKQTAQPAAGMAQRGSTAASLTSPRPSAAKRTPVGPPSSESVAFPASLPKSAAAADQMVAHFIDVGQGDAVLLEFSCAAVLIDTGGEATEEVNGRERLADYLRDFFKRRPDLGNTLALVVLSHPHKDHTDGVNVLLEAQPEITIENVLHNGTEEGRASGIKGQRLLQAYANETGAGQLGLSEADITTVAGVTSPVIDPVDCRPGGGVDPKITAVWGRVDLDTAWAKDDNNDSVVLRVDFGDASFLFTGDLEKEGIDAMLASYDGDRSIFNVDVLKVGHHGSHNATTEALMAAVTPKIAVIQAGDSTASQATFSAYSFAHPHEKAIGMLLDERSGVTMTRPPKQVPVGVRGRNPRTNTPPEFRTMEIRRAIYTSGWDGNIAVTANKNGALRVETGY